MHTHTCCMKESEGMKREREMIVFCGWGGVKAAKAGSTIDLKVREVDIREGVVWCGYEKKEGSEVRRPPPAP